MEIAPEHGYSWKSIAKLPCFGNKTDNCIWRKYRNLMIKKSKQEIIDQMRDCSKKDLVEKILAYKELTETKRRKAEQKLQEKRQIQEQRTAELKSSRQALLSSVPQSEEKIEMKEQPSDSVDMEGMQMEPE